VLEGKRASKNFFFEKKKQKTFAPLRAALAAPKPREAAQKLFARFFSKKRCLYRAAWRLTNPRHCERLRSNPSWWQAARKMDCFAALAMTWMSQRSCLLVLLTLPAQS
jgi:hypothetical protein